MQFHGKVRLLLNDEALRILCVLYVDMTQSARIKHVGVLVAKLIGLILLLYIFVCSLDIMSSAFRLVGGRRDAQLSLGAHRNMPRFRCRENHGKGLQRRRCPIESHCWSDAWPVGNGGRTKFVDIHLDRRVNGFIVK